MPLGRSEASKHDACIRSIAAGGSTFLPHGEKINPAQVDFLDRLTVLLEAE